MFLNNPVVMQGMGLAPLVVVATTGQNGLMLAAAVTLLLVPSRVLACLLSRLVPLRDEEPTPEQLQGCCPVHFCTQPAPLWCIWRRIPF